jgi:hypothetical protein
LISIPGVIVKEKKVKRRKNPVAKWSEMGEVRNRPSTIQTKKEKEKRGKMKYPKQYLEEQI